MIPNENGCFKEHENGWNYHVAAATAFFPHKFKSVRFTANFSFFPLDQEITRFNSYQLLPFVL